MRRLTKNETLAFEVYPLRGEKQKEFFAGLAQKNWEYLQHSELHGKFHGSQSALRRVSLGPTLEVLCEQRIEDRF